MNYSVAEWCGKTPVMILPSSALTAYTASSALASGPSVTETHKMLLSRAASSF